MRKQRCGSLVSGGEGIIIASILISSSQSRRHGGRRAMLVLEDAREEVSLMVVLLLSVRRNWKLANLGRDLELSIDVEARATGRGAESIGVSALEGRKQLNGMVSMCIFEWCAGVLSAQWAGRVGIKMNRSLDQRSLERSWESAVLGPVSLICVGDSAGKASRHAGKADRGGRRMCEDGTAATTIREA